MPWREPFRTGDQTLVREINLSLIMNRLHRHAPVSRADLADMTGLNKSTVSSLVNDLIENGFVHEMGTSSVGVGRPSVQLTLNPEAGFIVSVEVAVGFIYALCTDFSVKVLWELKEPIAPETDHAEIMRRVQKVIRAAIAEGSFVLRDRKLMGIAVGVPGLVKQSDGMLLFAPNLRWQQVPIGNMLREAFPGVPVFVDNEANMAALGEYYFGAAQDYEAILFISAGAGLGGAIVQSGKLMRGSAGFAGEFGHMTLYPDGEPCNCGNRGCWETAVNHARLIKLVRAAIGRGESTTLDDNLTVSLIAGAARAGDSVALKAFDAIGRELGIGIASLINILNPDLVLLGGDLSLASDLLMTALKDELGKHALRWSLESVTVLPSKQSDKACVMGGVAVVYQTILTRPGGIA